MSRRISIWMRHEVRAPPRLARTRHPLAAPGARVRLDDTARLHDLRDVPRRSVRLRRADSVRSGAGGDPAAVTLWEARRRSLAAANFLWNALRTPDWLLGGGEVRYMGLRTKIGDGPT